MVNNWAQRNIAGQTARRRMEPVTRAWKEAPSQVKALRIPVFQKGIKVREIKFPIRGEREGN